MLQKEAKALILKEWEKQPFNKRSDDDMFFFFCKIQSTKPSLVIFKTKGDPWQTVHCWLIEAERKRNKKLQKGTD